MPDFKSYAVLWMNQDPVESTYNMTGAFNHVSVRLNRGSGKGRHHTRMDGIPTSLWRPRNVWSKGSGIHKYLSEEFKQLTTMATLFPRFSWASQRFF